MAPLFGAAGQKVGKIVLQTSVGATIIAGISHILGPKSQQETIENKGFTQMRVEKNTNLLEVNLVGVSGVIIIGTIAIMFLCLCGKITTVMTKCKEMKERKQEERMEMVNLKKRRNEEKEEEKEEKEEEEKIKKEEEEEALKDI